MRKLWLLVSLSLALACGEPASVQDHGKTFKVTCYAGDKEIVKVDNATEVSPTDSGVRYTYQNKTYYVQGTCTEEEK